jgi:hypothetical protein
MSTKEKNSSFKLTRTEIERLYKVSQHFKEVNLFTIEQRNGAGIGVISEVRFDLFEKGDTKIDVTDVGSW